MEGPARRAGRTQNGRLGDPSLPLPGVYEMPSSARTTKARSFWTQEKTEVNRGSTLLPDALVIVFGRAASPRRPRARRFRRNRPAKGSDHSVSLLRRHRSFVRHHEASHSRLLTPYWRGKILAVLEGRRIAPGFTAGGGKSEHHRARCRVTRFGDKSGYMRKTTPRGVSMESATENKPPRSSQERAR